MEAAAPRKPRKTNTLDESWTQSDPFSQRNNAQNFDPFDSRDSLGRERGVNPRTFPSLGRFYLFYLGLGHAHSGMVRGGAKRARNFPARILVAHLERHPKKEEWAKAHSFFRGRR